MAALDFPNSPITGATYTGPNGVIWVWDGAKWTNGTTIGTAYAPIQSPVFTGNPTAPNPPLADNDTSVATTQFVQSTVAPAFNGVGRNLCHNPLFNVAQRGVGLWTTSGLYTLDRWQMLISLDTFTATQQPHSDATRAQIGDEAATSYFFAQVTGNAGAASYSAVQQHIEGVRRLAGKTVTISFYAAGSAGSKIGVSLTQEFGTGGSPSGNVGLAGQSVTISTAWTRYSVTFAVPSVSGKIVGTNGNDATAVIFWYSSGTTSGGSAGNIGVQTVNNGIWGVQLEVGSVATPLEKPDPRYDLSNCQRMFCIVTASARVTATAAGNIISNGVSWPVTMRAVPTVLLLTAPTTGNATNHTLSPSFPYGGRYEITSVAGGDCYALNAAYSLSADL